MSIIVVRPGNRRPVIRSVPEWKIKGWAWGRKGLEGRYQTRYGAWWGFVDMRDTNNLVFYVHGFSYAALRRHPKNGCFQFQENGWMRINMHNAINVDDGIAEVEKILTESLSN